MASTTSDYLRSLFETTRILHDWTQVAIGVGSLLVSGIAGWRFGLPWGLVTFLFILLVDVLVTGWRLQRNIGTHIPPGWNAILHGKPRHDGEWVPPGYTVIKGEGTITDGLGNVVSGRDCRVINGTDNNISGVGRKVVGGRGNTITG